MKDEPILDAEDEIGLLNIPSHTDSAMDFHPAGVERSGVERDLFPKRGYMYLDEKPCDDVPRLILCTFQEWPRSYSPSTCTHSFSLPFIFPFSLLPFPWSILPSPISLSPLPVHTTDAGHILHHTQR